MIKIKYILLCLLCLLALRTGAQSLVAYHVVGKVIGCPVRCTKFSSLS